MLCYAMPRDIKYTKSKTSDKTTAFLVSVSVSLVHYREKLVLKVIVSRF
jgi:hypothetical protein